MEQKVLAWCRQMELFSPGQQVAVALSGGPDSMALLTVLTHLREELGISLSAAHFHHGLRGREADRDEDFVRRWCERQGIPLSVGYGDTRQRAADTGESLEQAARQLRYRFFAALPADRIATAHHAEDNVETVLIHFLRGTGLRGMGGIPPARNNIVRPLLPISRQQILDYLAGQHIPFVQDSTNGQDDCLRNRIRHQVIPLLQRENPNLTQTVTRSVQLCRQEEAYLTWQAKQAADSCRMGEGYSCQKLVQLPEALFCRVLLAQLRAMGIENPGAAHVEGLRALVFSHNPKGKLCLPGGRVARRQYDLLLFAPPKAAPALPEIRLTCPGATVLPDGRQIVGALVTKNLDFRKKKATIIYLKCDMITQTITVRSRQAGDHLRLTGGTKSVKDLMIDRKIPAHLRPGLPVVLADGCLVAVFGLGTDPAASPTPGQPALVLTLVPPDGGEFPPGPGA